MAYRINHVFLQFLLREALYTKVDVPIDAVTCNMPPFFFYIFTVVSYLTKHNIRDEGSTQGGASVSGDWREWNEEMAELCTDIVTTERCRDRNSENRG